MATKKLDTVDVCRIIVASMVPTIMIEGSVDNGDGTFTLSIFNTYWMRNLMKVTIGGNKYRIISFVINETITIEEITSGAGLPSETEFTLPAPKYLRGVTKKASQESASTKGDGTRTPFIWVYETLRESEILDPLSVWGQQSSPSIYFMDTAQSGDWSSDDHDIEIIEPMYQMVEFFFEKINAERGLYDEVLRYDKLGRANWGKFLIDKGSDKRFFNEDLSGYRIEFDFQMSKTACDPRFSSVPAECDLEIVDVTTTPASTLGGTDGTATVNITGNQGNITFSWTTPDGIIPPGEEIKQTMQGLVTGTYVVVVEDDIKENCSDTDSGIVADGEFGFLNALEFDGVSANVSHPLITASTSVDYTRAYWVFPNIDKQKSLIFGDSGVRTSQLWRTSTTYRIASSGSIDFAMPESFAGGQWNHVVESRIDDILKVYFNKVESTTGGQTFANQILTSNISGETFKFNGLIDEYAFLVGTGATQADVDDLYNSGNGKDFITVMGSANLYYHMDESGTDSIAVDVSAFGNDGALNSFIFTPSPWKPHV